MCGNREIKLGYSLMEKAIWRPWNEILWIIKFSSISEIVPRRLGKAKINYLGNGQRNRCV